MTQRVLIVGSGIAGLSCAKLLARHGCKVEVCGAISSNLPILVLNNITCNLLLDVWQEGNSIYDNSYFIKQRNVYWGVEEMNSTVEQPSLVIRGDVLIRRLMECLTKRNDDLVNINNSLDCMRDLSDPDLLHYVAQSFDWVIDASGRGSCIAKILGPAKHYSFGHRCVASMEVELVNSTQKNAIWIETTQDGWIFLAPLERDLAILQAMVPAAASDLSSDFSNLLQQTRVIKTLVSKIVNYSPVFKAFPQILNPLCGTNWMSVGDAAVSFDPLSGDGTGHAARGAILAAAIINGIASGLPKGNCLHHYSTRLRDALFYHLKECLRYYYSAGFSSSVWQDEIKLMRKTFSYDLKETENFLFRLNGFELIPNKN